MNTTLQNDISLSTPPFYDVIIAGGGPVGLFLACELALAQCSVLILEKAEAPDSPLKRLPFGMRGLSAPTIEALYRRGLLSGLEIHKRYKNPHSGQENRQAGHFAGIPFYADHIDASQWKYRLPSATDAIMLSEMEELETVLTNRATALGVSIRRGQAITNFQQTDEWVTVLTNAQTFKAKWLVGCDGSRSQVRKAGGFEFAGTEPEFTGYSAQVDILDPEKLKPGRNVTERGMYLQSQPGYLIIQDFDQGAFHQSAAPITAQHLQEVLRRISDTDVTISALHIATTWTDRARQTTTYHNGRVLLAGDAAHIHAPLGGQGLNLGLGDAMNLGWKLAATVKNAASESLLDSYYTERYPVGIKVLEWSRAQVAIMKPEPQSQALNAIMRDLMHTRDGATYMASRIWGLNLQYNLVGNHPLVGCSVPNFEFEDGTTIGEQMYDGRGILLDFGKHTSLQALAETYSHQMKYISAKAKVQLGLSAVLIRRDGFVAWATNGEPDEKLIRQAAEKWFF